MKKGVEPSPDAIDVSKWIMNFTGARFILGIIPVCALALMMASLIGSASGTYKRAFALVSGLGMLVFAMLAGTVLVLAENVYMSRVEMHVCFGSFLSVTENNC